jgi:hypothetical protein
MLRNANLSAPFASREIHLNLAILLEKQSQRKRFNVLNFAVRNAGEEVLMFM